MSAGMMMGNQAATRAANGVGFGDIVDAVIHAREGIIPVDAKFPLENYVRVLEETDEAKRAEFERNS